MELFDKLIGINTAPSAEKEILDEIKNDISKYTKCVIYDKAGNLTAFFGTDKSAPTVAVYCTADSFGLVVTYIDNDGAVICSLLGNSVFPDGSIVRVTDGKNIGVCIKSEGRIKADFGFTTEKQARKALKEGDVLFFDARNTVKLKNKTYGPGVAAKSCVAALCKTANDMAAKNVNVYFVFLTQTVLGQRASYQAEFGINADFAFCVSPYEGKEIAFKIADKSVVCNKELTEKAENAALKCGIETVRYISDKDTSDASKIQSANVGTKVACIMMPSKYSDTVMQSVDRKNIQKTAAILTEFLSNIE